MHELHCKRRLGNSQHDCFHLVIGSGQQSFEVRGSGSPPKRYLKSENVYEKRKSVID